MNYYNLKINDCLRLLKTGPNGLAAKEALRRLKKYGPNKLPAAKPPGKFKVFFDQFKSPLIYVLVLAALIVLFTGEIVDAFIIFFVLVFNAVMGMVQEGRAQNTLLALKKFTETNAAVWRDGKEAIVPDSELVRGDVIILAEGERVPADARIIFARDLRLDEAALTGESRPVHKVSEVLSGEKELTPFEQKNMVFKGTHVVAGNGQAVVAATGPDTFLGKISGEISLIDTEIPLKTNIKYLSRLIILAVAGISLFLFFAGIFLGKPAKEMFTTIVSLAVSVIPEGLPIVITLVLATGIWRMSRHNALVKKLYAVEALGQARIIAVDKTGTLTLNEMEVDEIYANGNFFEVGGSGYEPKGEITAEGKVIAPANYPEITLAARVAALCSNARLFFNEENKEWKISGDPTEAALLTFAKKVGLTKAELLKQNPLIKEIPFDYKNKFHASLNKDGERRFLAVTGAPEVILGLCENIRRKDKDEKLTLEKRKELETIFSSMSGQGLRVLAFAFNPHAKDGDGVSAKNMPPLTFAGFYGLRDTLRPSVKEAVKKASQAGIRLVMITGDHKITAKAIAREAGIYKEGDKILTGEDLANLSEESLRLELPRVSIFARVTPEHKLKIIKAYKARGEITAMTGDGVNDAPSLVAADLGVAMGKIGTEVAKEAADIVLLDDNFGNIISAVEEGRSIYKTIKKVILYLFSTSIGEVLTIVGALFLGLPLPLLAAQIIWLNLVTDGFLDVALAMEPKEKGLIYEKFKKPAKYIVDSLMLKRMAFMAIPMMIGTLYLFNKHYQADLTKAWTMSLTVLAVFQWFNAWNCRHESKSIFQMNFFSNKFLAGATLAVIVLQLLAIYAPLMQKILRTAPLAIADWPPIILIACSIILAEELRKLISRRLQYEHL